MSKLRVLHLEDNANDAFFVARALEQSGYEPEITCVSTPVQFRNAIESDKFDAILLDHGLPGFDGTNAMEIAGNLRPRTPFFVVSGAGDERQARACMNAGASDYILKSQLWQLGTSMQRALSDTSSQPGKDTSELERHNQGMARLVAAVQELSHARSIETIMDIVRRAARELTGADGATFVLRDNEQCYYAEENAISPLWKGRRFPLKACISGWAMLNRQAVVIEDIYVDPRIPIDAYRPTFVKSLVMVPIRTEAPVGAIGNYWATQHRATDAEVELLQALANTTSVAMENVKVYEELEQRVRDRTVQLQAANHELETFSYSVSHDLRAPLRGIDCYAHMLADELGQNPLGKTGSYIDKIKSETGKMSALIEDLLRLAQFARIELKHEKTDLSAMATEIIDGLRSSTPPRQVEVRVQPDLLVNCDRGLMRIALVNLLSNAWKYSSKQPNPIIEFGVDTSSPEGRTFFVRDNGAGFDPRHASKLFAPFQRLHSQEQFVGTGVGLATVQRIIHRHGGTIRAEAAIDAGATFLFTLPEKKSGTG